MGRADGREVSSCFAVRMPNSVVVFPCCYFSCRYGGYKSQGDPEFPSGRIFWGSSAFFLWIGAYAGWQRRSQTAGGPW